jgi:predicted signal transduction protein with EAL and GGDEF domain
VRVDFLRGGCGRAVAGSARSRYETAEGVEDAPTLDLLRELGADHAQGFHTGHPAWLSG